MLKQAHHALVIVSSSITARAGAIKRRVQYRSMKAPPIKKRPVEISPVCCVIKTRQSVRRRVIEPTRPVVSPILRIIEGFPEEVMAIDVPEAGPSQKAHQVTSGQRGSPIKRHSMSLRPTSNQRKNQVLIPLITKWTTNSIILKANEELISRIENGELVSVRVNKIHLISPVSQKSGKFRRILCWSDDDDVDEMVRRGKKDEADDCNTSDWDELWEQCSSQSTQCVLLKYRDGEISGATTATEGPGKLSK